MIGPMKRRRQHERLMLRLAPLARAQRHGEGGEDDARLAASLPAWLRLRLVRADLEPDARTLSVAAGALIIAGTAAAVIGGPLPALVAILLTPAAALLLVEWRAGRNLDAFVAGLPFFLDSIQQLLRVGNSLQQALVKSSEAASPSVRRFLSPAVHRIQHGIPVPESLAWAAERIANAELRMFAAAVKINSRFGGSVASILANLGQLLRNGARVRRELKAATAEARFSGLVLMAMPVVISAAITAINPQYIRFFVDTAQGQRLAVIALMLQLTGMAVMRRLMRLAF